MNEPIEPIESGLRLRVLEGTHQEADHPLNRTIVSIGRHTPETPHTEAYLTFPEPTLSRLHAVLVWEPRAKTYSVEHHSQTNPSLLNGRQLTTKQLLKPGDILALGRLVVSFEWNPNQPSRTVPLTDSTPKQVLNILGGDNERVFNVPVRSRYLSISFSDARTTAPIQPGETDQEMVVRIPATQTNTLRLQTDLAHGTSQVELEREASTPTLRRTELPIGTLDVPVRPGTPIDFLPGDILYHQGYKLWWGEGAPLPPPMVKRGPVSEVDASADPGYTVLCFLSGGWKGSTLTIPSYGSYVVDLGPGSPSFRHAPAFGQSPRGRLTIHNGAASLRVSSLPGGQFVDVNGDLLFLGESVNLPSGSRILLGENDLVWCQPQLHELYSLFQVISPEGSHPIEKAEVRIGTAAHCEIRLKDRTLSPVVGLLKFNRDGAVYEHIALTQSARVDGVETSAGLSHPVHEGTKLELAPGVLVSVEKTY